MEKQVQNYDEKLYVNTASYNECKQELSWRVSRPFSSAVSYHTYLHLDVSLLHDLCWKYSVDDHPSPDISERSFALVRGHQEPRSRFQNRYYKRSFRSCELVLHATEPQSKHNHHFHPMQSFNPFCQQADQFQEIGWPLKAGILSVVDGLYLTLWWTRRKLYISSMFGTGKALFIV